MWRTYILHTYIVKLRLSQCVCPIVKDILATTRQITAMLLK